ncbi:unnamed protein product [Phaedon cochleariae]|uniref:Peptidase metallopeptidase domain-containing protein n=1 Tax=Phaedon cochleariae TaxID=80249 RepID=A0A9N9X0I4_PHACE|nr:unnamed protein product [Phaedon cochleariae]
MSNGVHIFLLTLSFAISTAENASDVKYATAFLERFGYADKNAITDLSSALIQFQERYNLSVSGELDETTLSLIKRTRCAIRDNDFTIHSKWNKTNVRCYYPQSNQIQRNAAKKPFDMWAGISMLKFEQVRRPALQKPDITITFGNNRHFMRTNCQGNTACPFNFDGRGTVLAHTFFPSENKDCLEIHFDSDENWYFGVETPPGDGQVSFLMVLVHELGHALGLGHSSVNTAVMYPWYQAYRTDFDEDDRIAIEYLYGKKDDRIYAKIPSSITTTPQNATAISVTSTTPMMKTTTPVMLPQSPMSIKPQASSPTTPREPPKLCEIQTPDFMFLARAPQFPNYRLYIGYKEFLWKIDLNDMNTPAQSEVLNDYLPPSLKNSQVSHVFQNSRDGMVILNEVNEKSFKTLNDLAEKILQRMLFIFKKYSRCDSVFLVFDKYDIKDSIKDMERRGHHNLGIFSITGSRPVPNYRNFLKSTPNKMTLIKFLSQYLMDSFKRLPGGKFLFIAGGSKDAESCFKVSYASIDEDSMSRCNHKEADTRLIFRIITSIEENSSVIINTDDTDVLVLLSYYHWNNEVMDSSEFFMETGH